jgi:leucyl aminopeptidase
MAAEARKVAEKHGLDIKVLERKQMKALGMGGLLGVAQGSEEPPKFIVLKYLGKNTKTIDIALVGKGITFDSGGISIKPSDHMGDMKSDMSGAASVIAAIGAIAQLKPKVNVMAIVPATENLPSGTAFKPADILTAMNGKTIEIITTDAEGRLILADALGYAVKQGAKMIVDIATLTGACQIALGDITTGAFTNNQELLDKVIAAAKETGDKMWQLPTFEEYKEQNKSDVADLKNTGGKNGGAITAALFVGEFAEKTPWVHLDIAGTALLDSAKGYYIKGATGVPTRTLIKLVQSLAK